MKKLLFVCLAFSMALLFSNNTHAQQKIGYFDDQQVLGIMPGFDKLSVLMESYQRDSLNVEYEYTVKDYQRQDSLWKKDSAGLAPKAREMAMADLTKLRQKLVYWQQYSEQLLQAKQEQLLQPFRKKIAEAMEVVIAEGKYTLVLKGDALSPYVNPPLLDNLALRIAIKMKLPLPKEVEDAWRAAGGTGLGSAAAPAAKPPVKKP